jgi:cell division protein FtsX
VNAVRARGRWAWTGLAAATIAWAVLFYQNYWNAVVPAYGSIDSHLATLRLVLWKYMLAALPLAAGWLAGARRATLPTDRRQGVAETAE